MTDSLIDPTLLINGVKDQHLSRKVGPCLNGQPNGRFNARLQACEIEGIVGFGSYRLGTWILDGSLMVSVSVLVSAFVIRNRLARPR